LKTEALLLVADARAAGAGSVRRASAYSKRGAADTLIIHRRLSNIILVCGLAHGQKDLNAQACAWLIAGANDSAMRFDTAARNGESKSVALRALRVGAAKERREKIK
jgi:hypothetical protein